MTDKEAIEFINNRLEIIEKTRTFNFKTDLEIAIETVLNLVQTQQAEIEKKDKVIDEVYKEANNILYLSDSSDYCGALWNILRIINPNLEEYPTLNFIDEESVNDE